MSYFASGLIVVWFAGAFFLSERAFRFSRLVLGNLAPGNNWKLSYFWSFRFRFFGIPIDPAILTESGKEYYEKMRRNDLVAAVWTFGGLAIIACYFSFQP